MTKETILPTYLGVNRICGSRTRGAESGQMSTQHQIELDGVRYTWTGRNWYESDTFLAPPQIVVRRLNQQLEGLLAAEDASVTNVKHLIKLACDAREVKQYHRAEDLARKALRLEPGNLVTLTVLSSILRACGRPQDALNETETFSNYANAPLLTTRAAALCDLKRWNDAKREIGRALAIQQSQEAFNVVRRIKAARSDLY